MIGSVSLACRELAARRDERITVVDLAVERVGTFVEEVDDARRSRLVDGGGFELGARHAFVPDGVRELAPHDVGEHGRWRCASGDRERGEALLGERAQNPDNTPSLACPDRSPVRDEREERLRQVRRRRVLEQR